MPFLNEPKSGMIEEIPDMKNHRILPLLLIAAITAAALWACAPRPVVTGPAPETAVGAETLFLQAQQHFENQEYDAALAAYRSYLARDPKGENAAEALLQIGRIFLIHEDYPQARAAFNQVIRNFPDSDPSIEARIGLLKTDYGEQKYDQVAELASRLLEEPLQPRYTARVYEILGDTYIAMQLPEDAIYFYNMGAKIAGPEQKIQLQRKLEVAIQLLDTADVISLLGFIQEDLPRSYLMYQLGLNYARSENYEDALTALQAYIKAYPDHEHVPAARSLIDTLSAKLYYNRTTVGCLLPLSGRYQVYGNRALKGIEMALDRFNRMYPDAEVQLVVKNTGSDPDEVVDAVESLVQERVAAIIGPLVNAEYAAAIAQENGIPIITFTQKEDITAIGDKVFRNFLTPEMQVRRIVDYATRELGVRNFAVLYPDEKYGATFMNLFWDEVVRHGGRIVAAESYNPAHTDFADPIKRLVGLYYSVPRDLEALVRPPQEREDRRADAESDEFRDRGRREEEGPEPIVDFEAIFIPDAPTKAGLIVPQLAFYDIEGVYLLGTNLWHSSKIIDMAKEYVQGAILADGFFPESNSERVRMFVAQFKQVYGDPPGIIEATSYDTALMLFGIIRQPEVTTRSAIRDQLLDISDFPGVTGNTSFDSRGEAQKALSILRIDGSGFVELQ
jgi:ABC-type branched-subunit amino acid transport system substrate-binding protein/predicted negative regulator of RcsB-dependent stress response